MKERPILMSTPMVRAILEGRKTQTRRVTKKHASYDENRPVHCPYGVPGDRLWVRETWCIGTQVCYRATEGSAADCWRPSIFMPRKYSRITLEITDVRLRRLQEISEEDSISEGITVLHGNLEGCYCVPGGGAGAMSGTTAKECFGRLWDNINAKRAPWASNPWVWALTFKRLP